MVRNFVLRVAAAVFRTIDRYGLGSSSGCAQPRTRTTSAFRRMSHMDMGFRVPPRRHRLAA
jgi:hypothetical protein